jgi:hypothetical protein
LAWTRIPVVGEPPEQHAMVAAAQQLKPDQSGWF